LRTAPYMISPGSGRPPAKALNARRGKVTSTLDEKCPKFLYMDLEGVCCDFIDFLDVGGPYGGTP
jgi:hypothetical protein